jgi:hypothetical protein
MLETPKDVIGGGGVFDTGAYKAKITMAYIDFATSEAMSVNLTFKTEDGRTLRSTQYVSSGKAKGCKNYYVDRAGNNQYLPGFALVDDICNLTIDTGLENAEHETKGVGIYDFDLKKEVMQEREVLIDLIGTDVIIAVERQVVDKNVKDASGNYVPSGETREQNEVVKAFHAEYGVTVLEAKGGLREPEFLEKWKDKNAGNVRNLAKGAKTGATPGAPAAATPAKSLFA